MPAISASELVSAFADAFAQSGRSAALVSRLREHPRKFIITGPDGQSVSVWLYAWTLTPGGRESLPDEYRIQMTSVKPPLRQNRSGLTLLMGYEPSYQTFAGFDFQRHRNFTKGSSSVQIDIKTVIQAITEGLAFDRKSNDEIAIGVRADQLMDYAMNAGALHRYGRYPDVFTLLNKVAKQQKVSETEVDALPKERQRIVQTINRLSRDARFRQTILTAYGHRCAVTRAQLKLVDAAHILPVGAPGSSDEVRNGIALAPTYHRAYDTGLVYLGEDLKMRINPHRVSQLKQLKLEGGLLGFESHLGEIHLPADKRFWPNPSFIKRANKFRHVSV